MNRIVVSEPRVSRIWNQLYRIFGTHWTTVRRWSKKKSRPRQADLRPPQNRSSARRLARAPSSLRATHREFSHPRRYCMCSSLDHCTARPHPVFFFFLGGSARFERRAFRAASRAARRRAKEREVAAKGRFAERPRGIGRASRNGRPGARARRSVRALACATPCALAVPLSPPPLAVGEGDRRVAPRAAPRLVASRVGLSRRAVAPPPSRRRGQASGGRARAGAGAGERGGGGREGGEGKEGVEPGELL